VAYACHPSYVGSINRRITVQAIPSINEKFYSKNKAERAGCMA
jgi:hypothetical protein